MLDDRYGSSMPPPPPPPASSIPDATTYGSRSMRAASPGGRYRSPSPAGRYRSPSPRGRYRSRSPPPPSYHQSYGGSGYRSRSPRPRYRSRSPPNRRYQERRRAPAPVYRGTEEERARSTTLFVGNVPYGFEERDVVGLFERFGRLRQVYIPVDRFTHRNKG